MSEEAYIRFVVKPQNFEEEYHAFRGLIEMQFQIVNERREEGKDLKGQDIITVVFGVKRK